MPDAGQAVARPPASPRWCRHRRSGRRPRPGRRRRRRAARAAAPWWPGRRRRRGRTAAARPARGSRAPAGRRRRARRAAHGRCAHGRAGWATKRSIGAAADTVTSKSPIGNTCSTSACTVDHDLVGVAARRRHRHARRHRRARRPGRSAAAALQSPSAARGDRRVLRRRQGDVADVDGDRVLEHEPERSSSAGSTITVGRRAARRPAAPRRPSSAGTFSAFELQLGDDDRGDRGGGHGQRGQEDHAARQLAASSSRTRRRAVVHAVAAGRGRP